GGGGGGGVVWGGRGGGKPMGGGGGAAPAGIVQLVELGDPKRNIPPCAACHRRGAGGPIETPVLAEQQAEYIARQLRLYASGERRNDVYARMRTIASKLTPGEIDGLAAYYRAGFR